MGAAAPLVPTAVRVTLRPVIIPLGIIAGLLVVRGLTQVIEQFVRAAFGTATTLVSWIPWLGKRAANGLHRVEARITNYLAGWEAGMEARISTSLHSLAHGVEDLAKGLEEIAWGLGQLAWLVTSKYSIASLYYRLGHFAAGKLADHVTIRETRVVVKNVVTQVEHPQTGKLGAGIKTAVRSVTLELDGFERWTIPRVKTAYREATLDIPRDIAALRARAKALTGRLDALYKWVRRHDKALATTALGSVAVAFIARLGGGWIFCRNWKRLGREVCRAPAGDITALLALLSFTLVAIDPKEVTREAQRIAEALEPVMRKMVDL